MLHRIARLAVGLSMTAALALPAWADQPPNIVFILADDLDIALFQKMDVVKTLITDEGVKFDNHYVTLSLCCPSRVSGLRGQFAHNTQIFTNSGDSSPPGGFRGTLAANLEASTFATWLQSAGYRTALIGKYLNEYPWRTPDDGDDTNEVFNYVPPGWTEWYSPVFGTPYRSYNYTLNENGVITPPHGELDSDYITDVIREKAADFITRSIDEHPTQPFFAYVAPYAPHYPAIPARRHMGQSGGSLPQGGTFNEANVDDKPQWIKDKDFLDANPDEHRIGSMRDLYKNRRRSLFAVEELVQRIYDVLYTKGKLEQTYLIFASDNGYHQGQHRLDSGKMTAYEEDLRIPLVARGPGISRGSSVTQLTANVDYASTFAQMAGAILPSSHVVDGRSLLGLMTGTAPPSWRQALLLEHKANNNQSLGGRRSARPASAAGVYEPADPMEQKCLGDGGDGDGGDGSGEGKGECITPFTGLRTTQHTYVEYKTPEFEIYDNSADPIQENNIYYTTATPQLKTQLRDWLSCLRYAAGTTLRQAELAAPTGPCPAPPHARRP